MWARVQALNERALADLDLLDGGSPAGKARAELEAHARTRGFDEKKVLKGRGGVPPALERDLHALAGFRMSCPTIHSREHRLRYWIRTAAVLFSAGFNRTDQDLVRAMGDVHCALMLAENFCCDTPIGLMVGRHKADADVLGSARQMALEPTGLGQDEAFVTILHPPHLEQELASDAMDRTLGDGWVDSLAVPETGIVELHGRRWLAIPCLLNDQLDPHLFELHEVGP